MRPFTILIFILLLLALTSNAQTTPAATPTPGPAPKTVTATNKPTKTKSTKKRSGDAIDKANGALDNADSKIDRASSTGDRAVGTISNASEHIKSFSKKAGALVPKKEKPASLPAEATNKTEIKIKGLNFTTLNKLNENIQGCPGVKSTAMEFSGSRATITVNHNGTSASLLKSIEDKSKDIFTDVNIDDFKEGKVSIKIKQAN